MLKQNQNKQTKTKRKRKQKQIKKYFFSSEKNDGFPGQQISLLIPLTYMLASKHTLHRHPIWVVSAFLTSRNVKFNHKVKRLATQLSTFRSQ